jgi:exopolyphosphatase/guanosine-5'-triphosphate,3'-diphosphate pyrophosphatase
MVKKKFNAKTFWWQVDIAHFQNIDIVSETLFRLGSTGLTEDGDRLSAYFTQGQFENEAALMRILKDEIGLSVSLEIKKIPAQDWETEWKKHFKPKKISKRFVIRPSWERYRRKGKEIELIIDPKMSFGTGTHETTRLVLQLLENRVLPSATVLDIGTGTGILAIAAAKLGARRVFAFDVDENSYANAPENIRRNRCADKIKVSLCPITELPKSWPRKYDVILANIQRSVIAEMMADMTARLDANGVMILSGILITEDEVMRDEFQQHQLLVQQTKSAGEWTAYVVKKKNYQRIASIDIGTNTVLLLIADIFADGLVTTLHEEQRIIRLGRNVDVEKNISMEGFEKCVSVLSEYQKIAADFRCDKIITCGTSALRDARNREWIHYEIQERIGLGIEILSGDDEALWTYHGGRLVGKNRNHQSTLIIDIGGGSTELILGDAKTVHNKISLDIGSVRLTERFLKSDPVLESEETELRNCIRNVLAKELDAFKVDANPRCIGVAGTVTTLAMMIQKMTRYRPEKINGFVMTRKELGAIIALLRGKSINERRKMKGLEPERADIIFAGALILQEAMDHFHIKNVLVSNYGLRYGMVLRENQAAIR